jgi:hypothetical protein
MGVFKSTATAQVLLRKKKKTTSKKKKIDEQVELRKKSIKKLLKGMKNIKL